MYLQPFNDVSVVPGGRHHGVPAGSVTGRQSPTHGCFLNYVVGFHKEVVHLVVEIHGDGDRSALGCPKHTVEKKHSKQKKSKHVTYANTYKYIVQKHSIFFYFHYWSLGYSFGFLVIVSWHQTCISATSFKQIQRTLSQEINPS